MKHGEISLVGRPVLRRKDFIGSYEFEKMAERGVHVLDSNGLFSRRDRQGEWALTYDSPQLIPFTLLGLYSHFRGCLISQKTCVSGSPKSFSVGINFNGGISDWRDYLKDELNVELGSDCTPGKNACIYARALYLSGFSTGLEHDEHHRRSKATREALLPDYLTFPVKNYQKLSGLSRKFANTLIRLTIDSFCDTRIASEDPGIIRYTLISQPTEEMTVEGGMQIISAMNALYPELELSRRVNVTDIDRDENGNGFRGRLSLFGHQLKRIREGKQRNYFPVRLQPRNHPYFKIKGLY